MKKIIILLILTGIFTVGCVSDDIRGARDGDLQAVKDYVSGGGDVNERKNQGMTLLMYASAGGHVPIIDYLMSVGADLSIRDNRGYTAFFHGAVAGKSNSMESLLTYGADTNDRDNGGNTALIVAAARDSYNTASFLLDRGADYSISNNNGFTPLLSALDSSAALPSGFTRTFTLLQDRGASFSPSDGPIRDIAFKAAGAGNRDVLSLLFDRGMDRNIRNSSGSSLLHAGVSSAAMTEFLLMEGLEIDGVDNKNRTPLMIAVSGEKEESVTLLLKYGARTDIRDSSRKTALLLASEKRNAEILRALILSGADIYATDTLGFTALHFSARSGTDGTVRILLTAGIYVNSTNGEGKTPYDLSFENSDEGEEIRSVLVTAGAIVPQAAQPAPQPQQPVTAPAVPSDTTTTETSSGAGLAGAGLAVAAKPLPGTSSTAVSADTTPPTPSTSASPSTPVAEIPTGTTAVDGTTPVAVPEPVPAVTVLAFSWPMVNPSRAEGWSNRDKLTAKGRFVLSYSRAGAEDYTEEYTFSLQGVNLKEGSLSREFPWDGKEAVTVKMILDTVQGKHLTGESALGGTKGTGPIRFETFIYR